MIKSKRRRVQRTKLPEISLTPLIDTFCVLLIIFIVAAPMTQNSIRVDLPQGKSREAGPSQDLVVTLSKDHKIFFNSYPVERTSLASTVQKALAAKEDNPVYVRADETVSYGKVIEIVDELKLAGVRYVAMSTRPI